MLFMLKLKCLIAQLHLGVTGNFNWRNTEKQTACSNLLCTLVMEDGRQKSKRLSYTANFKRELIRCAEDKGNHKAAEIFGVDESTVWLAETQGSDQRVWGVTKEIHWTHERTISSNWWCSLKFFRERRKTGLFVSYDLLRKESIKKARSLNIPRSRFKASKGWAIRFLHRMGLALRRRTTIHQKPPQRF